MPKFLSKNCNLVIWKDDKGSFVALIVKDVFLRVLEKAFSDFNKFEKVSITKGILNFSINHEKIFDSYLKRLEKSRNLFTEQ